MGGLVATALATRDPSLAAGVALVDSPPTAASGKLPFTARLGFVPVLGQALRSAVITNGMVSEALQSAFAPGYPVPTQFVSDFWKMTYNSYTDSHREDGALSRPAARSPRDSPRWACRCWGCTDCRTASSPPPRCAQDFARCRACASWPSQSAGHSPMVEKPVATAAALLPSQSARWGSEGLQPGLRAPRA